MFPQRPPKNAVINEIQNQKLNEAGYKTNLTIFSFKINNGSLAYCSIVIIGKDIMKLSAQ